MFVCESCKKVTNPREPMHKVVTQTRPLQRGYEIVKEEKLCAACADPMITDDDIKGRYI